MLIRIRRRVRPFGCCDTRGRIFQAKFSGESQSPSPSFSEGKAKPVLLAVGTKAALFLLHWKSTRRCRVIIQRSASISSASLTAPCIRNPTTPLADPCNFKIASSVHLEKKENSWTLQFERSHSLKPSALILWSLNSNTIEYCTSVQPAAHCTPKVLRVCLDPKILHQKTSH